MTPEDEFALAQQHHQAARLTEAEEAYRRILAKLPNHPPVLHMLGLLMVQTGRNQPASKLIGKAARLSPNVADYHANFGVVLDRLNRTHEAIAAFRAALALAPADAVVLCNLGDLLRRVGRLGEALDLCRQAVALAPRMPEAHNNLGKTLAAHGRLDLAILSYQAAVRLRPDFSDACDNLGDALRRLGRTEEAITQFKAAAAADPRDARSLAHLGATLLEQGKFDEALASIRRAVALRPDSAEAHTNLGNYFLVLGNYDQAIPAFTRAVDLKPDYAIPHLQLGWIYLLRGDFSRGWPEYQWRLRVPEFPNPGRKFFQPLWDGGDLTGKTIFLYGEQGYGDRIHLARYVPEVARRAAKVIFTDRPDLMPLYRDAVWPVDYIDPGQPLPEFDVHCSLASLPGLFQTSLPTIPATCPYLRAGLQRRAQWQSRLSNNTKFKVGLAWSGDPKNKNDRYRSLPLTLLAPLAQIPGVEFFSLQLGDAACQAARSPISLTDWTTELHDFAETAALIANLDLVVSVDTAVAHLSAALAKSTWILLPYACDWRWMLDRTDSPWYPTARLFRQKQWGQWGDVVETLTKELALLKRT